MQSTARAAMFFGFKSDLEQARASNSETTDVKGFHTHWLFPNSKQRHKPSGSEEDTYAMYRSVKRKPATIFGTGVPGLLGRQTYGLSQDKEGTRKHKLEAGPSIWMRHLNQIFQRQKNCFPACPVLVTWNSTASKGRLPVLASKASATFLVANTEETA